MESMKFDAKELIDRFSDYMAKHPKRFPNGGAALNIFATRAEEWEKEGRNPEKLDTYFIRNANGRFDIPPVQTFYREALTEWNKDKNRNSCASPFGI